MQEQKWLAIHYRDFDDPLDRDGDKYQGCWNEFDSAEQAQTWLTDRVNKSNTSPKGQFVLPINVSGFRKYSASVLISSYNGLIQYKADNLKKALRAYIRYKCRVYHASKIK